MSASIDQDTVRYIKVRPKAFRVFFDIVFSLAGTDVVYPDGQDPEEYRVEVSVPATRPDDTKAIVQGRAVAKRNDYLDLIEDIGNGLAGEGWGYSRVEKLVGWAVLGKKIEDEMEDG